MSLYRSYICTAEANTILYRNRMSNPTVLSSFTSFAHTLLLLPIPCTRDVLSAPKALYGSSIEDVTLRILYAWWSSGLLKKTQHLTNDMWSTFYSGTHSQVRRRAEIYWWNRLRFWHCCYMLKFPHGLVCLRNIVIILNKSVGFYFVNWSSRKVCSDMWQFFLRPVVLTLIELWSLLAHLL